MRGEEERKGFGEGEGEGVGYVFLKEMSREAFGKTAAQLRGRMESSSERV